MNDVQSRSGIDRRTVVRVGVATAWTVPLVQAAGTAPAFAACSGPTDLSTTTGTVSRTSNGKDYTISASIVNTGLPVRSLVVTVTLGGAITRTSGGMSAAGWSGGWSADGKTASFIRNDQFPCGSVANDFNLKFFTAQKETGTVTVTVGSTGQSPGSFSVTF